MQIVSAQEKAELEKRREDLYKQQIDVQERIRRGTEALANYDAEELAERTLRAEDGR